MAESTNLISIGEFSTLSRLSVRMLRHYDAHNVLVPASVDPYTGYRLYDVDQLKDAADIRNLRDVGFGVSAISALLAARGTPAWENALVMQSKVLADELSAAKGRLALIHRMIQEGETQMAITIQRVTVPAMRIATLRGTIPAYSDEGMLWQEFMPALGQQGIVPAGPCGAIEFDEEYTEQDVDIAVFMPIDGKTPVAAPLEVLELPERDCVMARIVGPYDQISAAHDLINERMVADGLTWLRDGTAASRAFNIYVKDISQVKSEDLVTEVYVPLG